MDELEEVRQRFVADVEEYVGEVQRAAGDTMELAASAEEAKLAAGGMRDKFAEAAAALKITRDEMGKLRNAEGEVITATEAQSLVTKKLRDQTLEAAFAQRELNKYEKEGMLARLGGSLKSGGGSLWSKLGPGSSLTEGIPLVGAAGPVGLVAIADAVQALLPEVAALATGLTAAGAGVGAFALLAEPAFGKVHSAYTQINADQQAYNRALTSKERATAMAHLKQDWASLDPAQAGAVRGVQQLTGEFHKMSTAFEPTAFKVFDEGLKIANQLLPYVGQFANAAAPAIEHLVGGLSRFVAGGEFRHFMSFLESLSGPAITAIGSGVAGLLPDIMHMMELFSKKDVINSINIAFRALGFVLTVVTGAIKETMAQWDGITRGARAWMHAFDVTRHSAAGFGHDVARGFDIARHGAAEFGHDVAHYFDDVRHDIAELGHDFAHGFDDVRHDVSAVTDWIASHGRQILAWLVDPWGMAVFEIRSHIHEIEHDADELRHNLAAHFDEARHDIARWADDVPHEIARGWDLVRHETAALGDWLVHEVESAFGMARHQAAASADGAGHDVASAWDRLRHETAAMLDDVVHWFEQLPGRILHELAALPGQMTTAGRNVILGLIRGIESAASAIPGIMHQLASDVSAYFTDPLKIFSPSRVFYEHGANTVLGYIRGIQAESAHLQATMRGLGAGVAAGGIPGLAGGYGGAAGGPVRVTVPLSLAFGAGTGSLASDPHFLQYIQGVVQEAVLRYNVMNPDNGLAIGAAGGRGL